MFLRVHLSKTRGAKNALRRHAIAAEAADEQNVIRLPVRKSRRTPVIHLVDAQDALCRNAEACAQAQQGRGRR